MKKQKIIFMGMLLLFIACNDKESSRVEVLEKEEILQKEKAPKEVVSEEKDLLSQLGFDFKDDKIVIDINKTTNFFTQIEAGMRNKAEEIELKIEKSDINMSKGMGIELEGNQIGIDLNKTKNMLQQINILMKDIFLDINSTNH